MDTYEKEYKDALRRANEYHCDGIKQCIIDTLEYIFPELKESEDERIRKSIYIYLDWLDGRKDYAPRGEYTIRDMMSWLEKQGQYQVKESAIPQHENKTCKENNDSLTNKNERIRKDIIKMINNTCKGEWFIDSSKEECLSWFEKQGEIYTKKDVDDAYLQGISDTKNELGKQGEQKSAWSEDDEKRLQSCINILKAKSLMGKVDTANTMWLKSIKERIGGNV